MRQCHERHCRREKPERAEVRALERSTKWKMNNPPQQPMAACSVSSAPAQSHMKYYSQNHRKMNFKGRRDAEHAKENKDRLRPMPLNVEDSTEASPLKAKTIKEEE